METKLPPLLAHQQKAIENALPLPGYGLFFEMGAMKTRTLIEILRYKYNAEKRILRTIILCPPIVIPNWVDEWKLWTKIDMRNVVPLYGAGEKRLKTFQKEIADGKGKIFITNYEALLMKPLFNSFQAWKPEVFTLDESHRCKAHNSKRSLAAEMLANPISETRDTKLHRVVYQRLPRPFTYLLSGSPILNSPMDIFQQYLILDGGETFGQNYFGFRARYFRDRNAGMPKQKYFPKWEIMTQAQDGFDALAEINRLIFSKAMRVEKKDCLDLPPEVSVTMKVGMSPQQKRLYDEMKKDFITFMDSKACTATLAITKALRLMQITSGFVCVSGQGEENDEPNISLGQTPKQEALEGLLDELVNEQKQKVLVWAVWKENYAQIAAVCQRLGIGYVEVHGGITGPKKLANVEQFKTDPNVGVLIGHPGSGGIGINLVVAGFSVFFSRTFSLEHYLQARARNHRGGSKEAGHQKITHYDLCCEGTIDEKAKEKLANKLDMSDKLLRELTLEIKKEQ